MTGAGQLPRIVIAGMGGDSGKTLVSLGLLMVAKEIGLEVQAFKKGPDYIDPAWLTWASGSPARNLDTFLMGFQQSLSSFVHFGVRDGLNVIEGNRGLYDGSDARGTHSTAELAKLLKAPVLLVVNATKVTRTAAACVLGCQKVDPEVRIVGVLLNQVSGQRHEAVMRGAIESVCGIPVFGALPRAKAEALLPQRHLGLVTPHEHPRVGELRQNLLDLIKDRLDLHGLLSLSRDAPPLDAPERLHRDSPLGAGLRIGVLRDSAFNFYYPENLEVLESAGARLLPISPLTATSLPQDLDALYIGGGFPETHGKELSDNAAFLATLRHEAQNGLPIYAECGGLMLLSRAIRWKGLRHPMAGVLPFDVEVAGRPQGHGYSELKVDRPNPYFAAGTILLGHEFHYSKIIREGDAPVTACEVRRGTGCGQGRDGVLAGNVWASYTHLHALATPEWPNGLLKAARRNKQRKA